MNACAMSRAIPAGSTTGTSRGRARFLLLLAASIASAAAGARATAAERVEPCPFRKGGTAAHATEESCGATGSCSSDWSITVDGLRIEDRGLGLQPADVRCAPGEIVVLSKGGDAAPVRLVFDAARRTFRLAPEVRARLDEASRMPAGPAAADAARRLLLGLSYVAPVAGRTLYDAALVAARQQLAAGRWYEARHTLEMWTSAPPDRASAQQRAALAAAAAQASASGILRATPRRIGKIVRLPSLPPFDEPTIFWRGDTLCVVQEDDAAGMRCHDPARGRWGPVEPSVRPAAAGLARAGAAPGCGGPERVTPRGGDASAHDGCGLFAPEDVVAAASGPRVVIASDGLRLWTRDGERAIDAAEATAIARDTPGSRIAGGGRAILLDGVRYHVAGKPETIWTLTAEPAGRDDDWTDLPAIASPDQRFVVAFSSGRTQPADGFTLWMFAVDGDRGEAPRRLPHAE